MAGKACDYGMMPSSAGGGPKTMAKKATARGGHNSFVKGGKGGRKGKGRKGHGGGGKTTIKA